MNDASMPRIEGLYESHLTVASLERSMSFYRDVVGLELAKASDARRCAFFWVNGKRNGMLGLWEVGTGPMYMQLHLAFRMSVDGVIASTAALRDKGVTPLGFSRNPAEEPDVIGWMPAVAQYFFDPDGHLIEFLAILDGEPDRRFGVRPYSEWRRR